MKKFKHIYVPTFVLLLVLTICLVKLKGNDLEPINIRTELYPVKVIETNGSTRTLWVQAKTKTAVNISFMADATTADAIIKKMRTLKK